MTVQEKIEDIIESYYKTHGKNPSESYIAGNLGWSIEQYKRVINGKLDLISYEALSGERLENDNITYDVNYSPSTENSETFMTRMRVWEVLDTLPEIEKIVLKMRFGIGYQKYYTLEECANYFSITREQVRQIESRALRRLRHPDKARKLLSLDDD